MEEDQDEMDAEIVEPYKYLIGLSVREFEDLLADIKVSFFSIFLIFIHLKHLGLSHA
jgi:hypothetical protein